MDLGKHGHEVVQGADRLEKLCRGSAAAAAAAASDGEGKSGLDFRQGDALLEPLPGEAPIRCSRAFGGVGKPGVELQDDGHEVTLCHDPLVFRVLSRERRLRERC